MKCPHCTVTIHDNSAKSSIGDDSDGYWYYTCATCPECKRMILCLYGCDHDPNQYSNVHRHTAYLFRPKVSGRAPVPPEVLDEFASDYKEACLVLADSPKASAALSRRCLQHILREKAGVKKGNLFDEIQEVINSGKLPSALADSLDTVRVIGNFATHPTKSKSSGEIVDVEPGEAEWNLDVIEALFDFYFVQPARIKAKRAALNKKLAKAGKPPLKR